MIQQCTADDHYIKISTDPMAMDVLTKIPWGNEETQVAFYCNVKFLLVDCDIFVRPHPKGLKILMKKCSMHFVCEAHFLNDTA